MDEDIQTANDHNDNGIYKTSENSNHNNCPKVKSSEKTKFVFTDKKYLIENEDSDCDGAPIGLNSKQANCWRTSAIAVSWISIIVSFTIGVIEFVVAKNENSAAAFGLAFSAILDVLTSIVVLWRFYNAHATFSGRREHISCIVLACFFMVSAVGIAGRAIFDLLVGETLDMKNNGMRILLITSIATTCLCLILFAIKLAVARSLASWTLFTDALNTLAGAIIALSMVGTSQATEANHFLWFLDSTVGLILSLLLLLYGIWLLVKHVPEVRKK